MLYSQQFDNRVTSVNDFSVEVEASTDEMITFGRNNSIPRPITWGGANWSIGAWVKPLSETPVKGSSLGFFDHVDFDGIDLVTNKNRKYIAAYTSSGDWQFDVFLVDTDGSTFICWNFDSGSTDLGDVFTNGVNEWNFCCITYDESETGVASKINVYMNGQQLTASGTTGTSITMDLDVTAFSYLNLGMTGFGPGAAKFLTTDMMNARWHRLGLWNNTLTSAEQSVLYNNGSGAAIGWNVDQGAYGSSSTLDHYYLLGEDQSNLVAGSGASGGKTDGAGGPGTGLGVSTLWDCGLTTSSGWDLNGSDLGVGFPDFVEDAPL